MTAFSFSDDNKRYHTLYYYNKHAFGCRVYKAAIDAGLSCPNRDGRCGTGGCTFCSGGSGYFTSGALSVREQYLAEERRIRAKCPNALIQAYFQAGSNTYADVETLARLYGEAIACGAASISVATRADCLDRARAELLAGLPVPVTVELGLQTVHDETAARVNRCHSFADFLRGYALLKEYGLRVCVHIIDGLPRETRDMMLQTAEVLGRLRPDGVKIHLLHVIKGTPLAQLYESGGYQPMSREEYIDTVVSQLELLPPHTVIERLTGDGDKRTLLAPLWSADKIAVLGGIDKRQRELDTWQGKRFTEE